MRAALMISLVAVILCGCAATEPAISKSSMGNLAVCVYAPKDRDMRRAELFLDGLPIGNATPDMPVLHVRRGTRTIRVECPGCKPTESKITILGDPNHQVLNVFLEPE